MRYSQLQQHHKSQEQEEEAMEMERIDQVFHVVFFIRPESQLQYQREQGEEQKHHFRDIVLKLVDKYVARHCSVLCVIAQCFFVPLPLKKIVFFFFWQFFLACNILLISRI